MSLGGVSLDTRGYPLSTRVCHPLVRYMDAGAESEGDLDLDEGDLHVRGMVWWSQPHNKLLDINLALRMTPVAVATHESKRKRDYTLVRLSGSNSSDATSLAGCLFRRTDNTL